jgi:hypothetical protein
MVKRCTHALEGYEEKLHLIEKFLQIKGQISEIQQLAKQFATEEDEDVLTIISQISGEILEEL